MVAHGWARGGNAPHAQPFPDHSAGTAPASSCTGCCRESTMAGGEEEEVEEEGKILEEKAVEVAVCVSSLQVLQF